MAYLAVPLAVQFAGRRLLRAANPSGPMTSPPRHLFS
jgi:hypothetical protein